MGWLSDVGAPSPVAVGSKIASDSKVGTLLCKRKGVTSTYLLEFFWKKPFFNSELNIYLQFKIYQSPGSWTVLGEGAFYIFKHDLLAAMVSFVIHRFVIPAFKSITNKHRYNKNLQV